MKFENTEVFNFEGAMRGMRNPLASWYKSDSYCICKGKSRACEDCKYNNNGNCFYGNDLYVIGENDMDLAKRLIKGGSEHRKFLRQIMVSVDITAPLYLWKEADTYKINTTANSTSTMHKLTSEPITMDCFEMDDFDSYIDIPSAAHYIDSEQQMLNIDFMTRLIDRLEGLRLKYNETKDKRYWKELVRWLPESWLQTRTWTANYEVIYNMYCQRKGHKLTEWKSFIDWAKSLPYFCEFFDIEK